MSAIFDNAKLIDNVKVVSAMMTGVTAQMLRKMGDNIKAMDTPVIAVIAGVTDDKGNMICACSKPAQEKGAHAGKIVQRIAAITGGKGGGRPDTAMAGIGQTYMIDEALMALENIVNEMINK